MIAPTCVKEYFAPFFPKDAKNRFIAMLRAYFDDSGTHEASPIVIVGGIVIRDEQHDLLREIWDSILKRNNLLFFHATRFKTGKEAPYSAMSETDKEALLDQLVRIMCVRQRMTFSCAIPIADYESAITEEEKQRYGSAYSWAVQWCWTIIRLWCEKHGYDDPIPFVVESGAKDEEHLSVVFNKIVADPLMKKLYRLHSMVCGAKTDFVGLQAADIIANSINDIATHHVIGGRPPSKWMNIVSYHINQTGSHSELIGNERLLRSELDSLNENYSTLRQKSEMGF